MTSQAPCTASCLQRPTIRLQRSLRPARRINVAARISAARPRPRYQISHGDGEGDVEANRQGRGALTKGRPNRAETGNLLTRGNFGLARK
jgi:hypothetical protein